MHRAGSPPAKVRPPRFPRWLAPALLLAIVIGLAPLWWEVTAPPNLATAKPWRDATGNLMVPAAAVRAFGPQGKLKAAGAANLFVVRDGMVRLTRIQLGAMHDGAIEVRDGLEDAALVVANPPRGLEDRHRIGVR